MSLTEPTSAGDAPDESASKPDSTLCEKFGTQAEARDQRFLLWEDGRLELELYIDKYYYDDIARRVETASWKAVGKDASVEMNLEATEIRLLLVADYEDWQKLGENESDVVIEVTYDLAGEEATCTLSAKFFKVEITAPSPRPLAELEKQLFSEGLGELGIVDLGATRLHYWGDEISAEYFEKGASLGTRCLYSKSKQAVEAPCPLSRDAINDTHVLIEQNVVPHDKVWEFLRGEYEPFYADARRSPYSPMRSVVKFERWTGPHTFQLSSACCGDSEVFEYDIRTRERTRVSTGQ